MIKEFSTKPKPQNNTAKIVFFVTLFVAFAGIATYLAIDKYKGIVAFLSMLVLVSAILIYTKYIAPVFLYDIMLDEDGTPLFVVRQLIGKRTTTLCRIALAEIISVKHIVRGGVPRHKTPKGVKKYNYAPSMHPKEFYLIETNGKYEKAEVRIEGSEEFINLLTEYSKEAKEIIPEE